MSKSKRNITNVIKDNFRFSTLSFIFIIFYVNIFQILFGPENSIVGVIVTIMMSASMVREDVYKRQVPSTTMAMVMICCVRVIGKLPRFLSQWVS